MVLAEVRRSVGPCFPVLARISADEFVDGGNTLADTIETLRGLAGLVDVLDVSSGSSDSADTIVEPASYGEGWRVYLSAEIKRSCPIPTIAVGNIRTPEFAEKTIAEGRADLVAIGRGLVCDPDWVAKVAAGEQDRIIRCASCNEGCLANRILRNKPIACVLNPGQFDA
jgi:2,4-dienoyl-CoA reductase-like NADH-dependent reductase (Old Yellow Enzyme family)